MRIGVLTHHHIDNEGAVLQAYAQAKMLQASFPKAEVEIVDLWIKSYSKMKKSRRGIFLAFQRDHLPLSSRRLISDDYEESVRFVKGLGYDMLVVGSDEVWKLEWGKWGKSFPNIYWLSPRLPGRKIAMSTSANLLHYKNRPPDQLAWMKKLLNGFDLLGARDNHTLEFLRHIGIPFDKVTKTCDPAIAYTFPEIDLSKKLSSLGLDLAKPVLGIRIPNSRQSLIAEDCRKFKAKGYQIVSFMHKSDLADFYLGTSLNPLEWANVFRYLDFCISNSYHSLIFSLKNGVPIRVVDFDESYTSLESKTHDLLRDMGMLYCYGSPESILEQFKVIPESLERLKGTYEEFLLQVKDLIHGGDAS